MRAGFLVSSWGAALVGASILTWVVRTTDEALPALTRRPVAGAPIDARPGGSRTKVGASSELPPLPAEGRVEIDLATLAFDDYDPPELRGGEGDLLEPEEFPPAVARLHGREVELEGFPLITRVVGERADRLLLTRFPPGCCFGAVPVLDEWVAVELAAGSMDAGTGFDPVRVRGNFVAGEVLDEKGRVDSLYRLVEAQVVP